MAQEGPISPEKELLRLIEDPEIKSTATRGPQIVKRRSASLFSASAWKGRISFLKEQAKGRLNNPIEYAFDIKSINRGLLLLTIIVGFYVITNLTFSVADMNSMPDFQFDVGKMPKPMELQEAKTFTKPLTFYLEKVRSRDLFKMGREVIVESDDEEVKTVIRSSGPSKLVEMTQDLRLVGISWSKDPDAMIEDTKASRTFFVKRGHKIGGMRVEAIFKDKIVLSYEGEETELR